MSKSKKLHDHRQSTWIIAGGSIIWCYQCGAWRLNVPTVSGKKPVWHKPSGVGGENPAIRPNYPHDR